MRIPRLLLTALLLAPVPALATGFLGWSFGMTREQVQAQTEYGPYYPFRNGDLGSQAGPFRGSRVPISFYFNDDRLTRVMLIAYIGKDLSGLREALQQAVSHLTEELGGVELPEAGLAPAAPEAVLAAFDDQVSGLSPGQRFQAGAFPMPSDRRAWVSVTALQEGMYMVAVNYAEP